MLCVGAGATVCVWTGAGELLDGAALVATGTGLLVVAAVWVADAVGLTSVTTGIADATGLGVLDVGDLDPPPAAAPMISRTSKPTETPETDRILPRCVCGLRQAHWYNLAIR